MTETSQSDSLPDTASSVVDDRHSVPNTSMLPGAEKSRGAAVGLLKHAVQGAHASIDRLSDRAEPVLQKLEDGVSASQESRYARTDPFRDIRVAWTEGVRDTVRSNPLASIAAALVFGLVIARLNRPGVAR